MLPQSFSLGPVRQLAFGIPATAEPVQNPSFSTTLYDAPGEPGGIDADLSRSVQTGQGVRIMSSRPGVGSVVAGDLLLLRRCFVTRVRAFMIAVSVALLALGAGSLTAPLSTAAPTSCPEAA